MENVFPEGLYFAGGDETVCLRIKKERLIVEGQGDAVIYDKRDQMINAHPKPMEPSSLAHTVLIEAREAEIRGLTFVNGCNIDFEYRGKTCRRSATWSHRHTPSGCGIRSGFVLKTAGLHFRFIRL